MSLEDDFLFKGSDYYLEHVLFNLLKNTYKYGGEDSHINIWLKNHCIYFEDDGPGINEADLPYVFDRFYTTESTGMGMGLAFCKSVMEEFKGKILCESKTKEESKNTYTLFKLSFPSIKSELPNTQKASKNIR